MDERRTSKSTAQLLADGSQEPLASSDSLPSILLRRRQRILSLLLCALCAATGGVGREPLRLVTRDVLCWERSGAESLCETDGRADHGWLAAALVVAACGVEEDEENGDGKCVLAVGTTLPTSSQKLARSSPSGHMSSVT